MEASQKEGGRRLLTREEGTSYMDQMAISDLSSGAKSWLGGKPACLDLGLDELPDESVSIVDRG